MTSFNEKLQNKQVKVKLNSGETVTGTFKCMDGLLNIVLQDATVDKIILSEALIRGNNVLFIAPISKPA